MADLDRQQDTAEFPAFRPVVRGGANHTHYLADDERGVIHEVDTCVFAEGDRPEHVDPAKWSIGPAGPGLLVAVRLTLGG